nr:hypothetical protein [Arboricoccus pini]
MRRFSPLAFVPMALLCGLALPAPVKAAPADYPTEELADYVFGCMAANGQTQTALRACSCSIDTIAAKLPFADYERAETVMSMQQIPGGDDRAVLFRTQPLLLAMVDKLKAAQVEAEQKCFPVANGN